MHRSSEYYRVDKTSAFFRSYLILTTTSRIESPYSFTSLGQLHWLTRCLFSLLLSGTFFLLLLADANWVAQRAELQQRRTIVNLRHKARTGLPSHKRPAIGGVEHFRLTKSQRYRGLKPRKEGDQPPQGEFPEGMLQQQQGHGQTKEALFQGKIKKEKEYH